MQAPNAMLVLLVLINLIVSRSVDVPGPMYGVWVGSMQTGAGFVDVKRDSSIACVASGADILIPNVSIELSSKNVTVSAIATSGFISGSASLFRRGTPRRAGRVITFENSILEWREDNAETFSAFVELDPDSGLLTFVELHGRAAQAGVPKDQAESYSALMRHRSYCEGSYTQYNLVYSDFMQLVLAQPDTVLPSLEGPWTASIIVSSYFVPAGDSGAQGGAVVPAGPTCLNGSTEYPTGTGAYVYFEGTRFQVLRRASLASKNGDRDSAPYMPDRALFLGASVQDEVLMLLDEDEYRVSCAVWKMSRSGDTAAMAVFRLGERGVSSPCYPAAGNALPEGWETASRTEDGGLPCESDMDGTMLQGVQVLHLQRGAALRTATRGLGLGAAAWVLLAASALPHVLANRHAM